MGGQACILYGGAQFSRDADVMVLADAANLARLQLALDDLAASPIAVPPFDVQHLLRGHAVHFRCQHPDVRGIRLDVMTTLRDLVPFADLWARRTSMTIEGVEVQLLSLADLVQAKKTQREKDWPMIGSLVEASYARSYLNPTDDEIAFWLQESRSLEILLSLAENYSERLPQAIASRPLLVHVQRQDETAIRAALAEEQRLESEADRAYWAPLKAELEQLRLGRRQ